MNHNIEVGLFDFSEIWTVETINIEHINMKEPKVTDKKEDASFNLDSILAELGSFGKYQLFLLFLLAFRDSFLAMCNFHYVFTAAEVNFR